MLGLAGQMGLLNRRGDVRTVEEFLAHLDRLRDDELCKGGDFNGE